MGVLEDNLRLGLEAVKYAKQQVRRSANQTYIKYGASFSNQKLNEWLLKATRGGEYSMEFKKTGENEEGEDIGRWEWTKDVLMCERRQEVENILLSSDADGVKEEKLIRKMNSWGKNCFVQWGKFEAPDGDDSRWDSFSLDEKNRKMTKRLGKSKQEVELNHDAMVDQYITQFTADDAKKFGTGNCDEKAHVAATYILNRTPGGKRLTIYQLDPKHKGVTGFLQGKDGGGDHVFAVYGHDNVTTNIGSLGASAIIVDGWMNDAYPAQHYLALKHGLNYDNARINIKQHTTRSMVCCSYRSHVKVYRDYGTPAAGPASLPQSMITRRNF